MPLLTAISAFGRLQFSPLLLPAPSPYLRNLTANEFSTIRNS